MKYSPQILRLEQAIAGAEEELEKANALSGVQRIATIAKLKAFTAMKRKQLNHLANDQSGDSK